MAMCVMNQMSFHFCPVTVIAGNVKKALEIYSALPFFKHAHFRFTLGNPVWYETAVAARGFCGRCGTPIAFQHNDSRHIAIMLGTLDEAESFEPQAHWYSDSKLPWVDIQSTLPDATDNLGTYRE